MIRVLIERQLKKDQEAAYHDVIRQMKQKASHKTGYISGEILVNPKDSCKSLVLSSWTDLDSWQIWHDSDERQKTSELIRGMLAEDERISVYQPASIVN